MQIACPDCGAKYKVADEHAGKSVRCKQCGVEFTAEPMEGGGYELDASAPTPTAAAAPAPPPPAMRPSYSPPSAYAYTGPAATSKLAVWALVLGLIGLIPIVGILPGLVGAFLGIVALSKIGSSNSRLKGGGMAVTGIVTGGVGLLISMVFGLMFAIMMPALGVARTTARRMTNSTQQRGIHQGMVTFAQGNKTATGDGFYPGMDRKGEIVTGTLSSHPNYAGGMYDATTDGTDPGYRYAILLNGSYFTPEYLIAPPDGGTITPAMFGGNVTSANYSYAALEIAPGAAGRQREWKETINSSAAVLSDRNTGPPNNAQSIWTSTPGEWTGTVTMNDGSSMFVNYPDMRTGRSVPIVDSTRYGGGPVNPTDHLFKDETNGDDALMITGP